MSIPRRSVCLISSGLVNGNWRLQPWRYLREVARQLAILRHEVNVISDGSSTTSVLAGGQSDVTVHPIPSVNNYWWQRNAILQQTINRLEPDIILWHVGLTSLLHQHLVTEYPTPVIGIFTSPIYDLQDLKQIGTKKLVTNRQLSAIHLIGTLVPKPIVRYQAGRNRQMQRLVVQTETTRQQLIRTRLWSRPIDVIAPGVDEIWHSYDPDEAGQLRAELGYNPTDKVIVYFGSPAELRGLHTLIRAFAFAVKEDSSLQLLVLSRRHEEELLREDAELHQLLKHTVYDQHIQIISGYLASNDLVAHVAASDIVALPFELVPSDAPLSLLEARALGKPIVTTSVACLSELATPGKAYLAQPADIISLARAIKEAIRDLDNDSQPLDPQQTRRNQIRGWNEFGSEWANLIHQHQ